MANTLNEEYFRIPLDPENDQPYVLENVEEINNSSTDKRRSKPSVKKTNVLCVCVCAPVLAGEFNRP